MDEFDCSRCGSEDVQGERQPGGTIMLTCQSCRATWARTPSSSCPRCGAGDVEEYGQEDGPDDPPGADGDPTASPGHGEWRRFRCRKCRNTWGKAR